MSESTVEAGLGYDEGAVAPSQAIIDAVADAEETTPLALDPPLYEAVDPDALDTVFQDGTDGTVSFSYHGYAVEVSSGGEVVVSPVDG